MFICVISPESLIDVGNHLAGVTGYDIRDFDSFQPVSWEKDGVNYSVMSAEITDNFQPKVEGVLVLPDFDDGSLDLTKAQLAQSKVTFTLDALSTSLTARYCKDAVEIKAFIVEAGITRIPVEIE